MSRILPSVSGFIFISVSSRLVFFSQLNNSLPFPLDLFFYLLDSQKFNLCFLTSVLEASFVSSFLILRRQIRKLDRYFSKLGMQFVVSDRKMILDYFYLVVVFLSTTERHTCVTQIWITKIVAKCILVVVVKWRQMSYFETKTNLTHSKSSCWQTWPAIMESRTSRAWTSIVSSASRVWCWWGASAEVTSWESLWRTETSSSRLFCNASFCLLFWKQRSTSRLNMTWDWWLKNKQTNKQTNKQEILWGFASWLLPSE